MRRIYRSCRIYQRPTPTIALPLIVSLVEWNVPDLTGMVHSPQLLVDAPLRPVLHHRLHYCGEKRDFRFRAMVHDCLPPAGRFHMTEQLFLRCVRGFS